MRSCQIVGPAVLLLLSLLSGAGADEPAAARSEARAAGLRALQAGDRAAARRHLRRALEDHPQSPLLLADLLEATTDQPGAHAWWAHQYVASIADRSGASKPTKEAAARLPKDDPHVKAVAAARARAAAELARLAGGAKGPGASFAIQAWRRLFDRVAEASPALRDAHGDAFDRALAKALPTTEAVVAAMEAAGRAGGSDAEAAALRLSLGRALVGLSTQARQRLGGAPGKDPTKEGERLLQAGERLVHAAEAALAGLQMEPATVAALEAMKPAEVAAFNETRTRPEGAGRATTPTGRYEVWTPCGHGTLLAVARMAEGIHGRLARWMGGDPFEKRRGLIRIVPECRDLEGENAPYWWAEGFQRGLVTTVRFCLGTNLDLAGLLTHELTHRFDATIHPALPAWCAEGRAVWTAAAFRSLRDETFREHVADGGRIGAAWHTWYGTEPGLAVLLRDEVKDYRDNYTAGHALWTYLYTWPGPDGRPLFREPLSRWLAGQKTAPRDPVATFAATFCDGGAGRPVTLAEFANGFRSFMEGFRAYPPPEWVRAYAPQRDREEAAWILDGPTISRERRRDEPSFGQDHVGAAADALARLGRDGAAVALLEWAHAFDEIDGGAASLAVDLLTRLGAVQAAAAAHLERLRRGTTPETGQAPSDVARLAPKAYDEYLAALAAAARDYAARGWTEAAAWFRDEHDLLARPVDRPALVLPPAPEQESQPGAVPHLGAPVLLGARGWVEDGLTDYDRFRKPGLWLVTPEGNVLVGASSLDTLQKEHVEEFYSAFVRSTWQLDSGYVLRTRVHLLTPHVSGAVVLGWRRRDRNVRVHFLAGQRPHVGEGPQATRDHAAVYVTVAGMRRFDYWHAEGSPSREVRLARDDVKNAFDLVVRVEGCRLEAFVEGEPVGTYVDAAGLPLDGAVGFATDAGIARMDGPVVERVRLKDEAGVPVPVDAELAHPRRPMGDWVVNRRIQGLTPGPHGAFVFWYPLGYGTDGASPETVVLAAADDWADLVTTLGAEPHGAGVVVAIPEAWPEDLKSGFEREARKLPAGRGRILRHGEGKAQDAPADPRVWGTEVHTLFVDPVGLVRHHADRALLAIPETWKHWLLLTRGW